MPHGRIGHMNPKPSNPKSFLLANADETRFVELSPNLAWSGDELLTRAAVSLTRSHFPDGVGPAQGEPQAVIAHRIAELLYLRIVHRPPSPKKPTPAGIVY